MDIKLESLFRLYDVAPKEQYEIRQIYSLLPSYKKIKVIENFEGILEEFSFLQKELHQTHRVLLGNALDSIETKILQMKKQATVGSSSRALSSMKKSL